ncbi:patatin-like phospholipase family protein [Methylopila sp. Yamaguchi]|uniref:patatin-like phospholipase family protein n=1 Tax=Methylopila sp. Yamaguchi TaxID=1437817 RepID=UPI000CC817E2|nr:patatin-like phospholipase family protein [Methylopila sp. Yamaguchi]GBD48446.1 patatin [Methylopila sp. Yamaguchi]
MTDSRPSRRIGLALGGGGARGLAHLHALEAFDELGLRPSAIAGVSIGAIYGAAYAAGLSAKELRAHTAAMLRDRGAVLSKLMKARVGRLTDLFGAGSRNPVLVDAELLLAQFLPDGVPETFDALQIPFVTIATDFFGRAEIRFDEGPLRPAVAASIAIPGLFRPVVHHDRTLIDGAMTNPLPFDALDDVDAVIAVDVTGGPVASEGRVPNAFETTLGSLQIMQTTIVAGKLARRPPEAVIRPNVEAITLLDFLKTTAVLRASEAAKGETKRAIEAVLS